MIDGKELLQDVLDNLPELDDGKNVCLSLSGGLDSTTALYVLIEKYGVDRIRTITFDFGQTHSVELEMVKRTVQKTGVFNKVVTLSFLAEINRDNCSLISGSKLKHKTHTENAGDPQISSYVSHRNLIFTSIVASFAENNNCAVVMLGLQQGDVYSYWDTSLDFVQALNNVLALNRKNVVTLITPFVEMYKDEEIRIAGEISKKLGYDLLQDTWTCYNGNDGDGLECGLCSSCADKLLGYVRAGCDNDYIMKKFRVQEDYINNLKKSS
jgi:7-cyano-7-deazaguanine synthase